MTALLSPPARSAAPGSFRELWQVALPMVLSSGSLSLMHFVDRVFLTWYSKDALAAATPAGMLLWTVMSVVIGTVTYVNTFVAQYEGAGRPERVAAAVWQGVYLSFAAGLLFLLVTPFIDEIFALIGHPPEVQRLEAEYFSISCYGAVPMIMASALASFYSGRGKTVVVMYVNLTASLVNGVLDYLLIFGAGPSPRWGIWGAGLATVLANVAAVLIYTLLMRRKRDAARYGIWHNWRFDPQLLRRLLRYGLPTGIQFMADIAGITAFVLMVGLIGKTELAATNLAFNLNTLAFIPMLGIGTAVMTLVGMRIGERRPELAVRTTWLAFALAGAYMLAFAAIYLLFPDQLLYLFMLYSSEGELDAVRDATVQLLRFVAVYSFFDGMAIVFGSAIRGAGDTRFSLIFTALCAWLVMVGPTYAAWQLMGGSMLVSWSACSLYIIILGVGFLIRFQLGHWKSMRVIEHEPLSDPDTQAPR